MSSRRLSDLQPEANALAFAFLSATGADNFDVLIYCTLRSDEEQARLFRKGRTLAQIQSRADELDERYGRPDLAAILIGVGPQSGHKIVTWAGPGQSAHNYGMAFDGCPLLSGKPVWSPVDIEATPDVDEGEMWMRYGDYARAVGLRWAGDWPKGKREYPHCQVPGFSWKDMIRQ